MTNTRQYAIGSTYLLATAIIWGLQFPVAKGAFEIVDAFHSSVFRFGVPALIMVILLWMFEGRKGFTLNRQSSEIAGLGVLGMCATPSLIFGGLMLTRPEIAAVIVATQPIISVLVQRLWHKEKPDLLSTLCVLVAFIGVITVVTHWDTSLNMSRKELIGDLMIFTGAICWVIYSIACGKYPNWSNLRLTAWTLTTGTVGNLLLVVTLVTAGWLAVPSASDWFEVRFELIFLAFIGVLVAMYSWNSGSRMIGAINAMLFVNLIPVVTFAVRHLQGHRIELIELLGASLVIAALLIQNFALRRKMQRMEPELPQNLKQKLALKNA